MNLHVYLPTVCWGAVTTVACWVVTYQKKWAIFMDWTTDWCLLFHCRPLCVELQWGSTEAWYPGVKEVGSLQEAAEEKAGSGILKGAGTWRKRKTLATSHNNLQSKQERKAGASVEGSGTESVGTSKFPAPVLQCSRWLKFHSDEYVIIYHKATTGSEVSITSQWQWGGGGRGWRQKKWEAAAAATHILHPQITHILYLFHTQQTA